jgi:hypothetical protein
LEGAVVGIVDVVDVDVIVVVFQLINYSTTYTIHTYVSIPMLQSKYIHKLIHTWKMKRAYIRLDLYNFFPFRHRCGLNVVAQSVPSKISNNLMSQAYFQAINETAVHARRVNWTFTSNDD